MDEESLSARKPRRREDESGTPPVSWMAGVGRGVASLDERRCTSSSSDDIELLLDCSCDLLGAWM